MKKYQSSCVLKQIKKKRIFEKKIHMDFPYGFSIQLDTRNDLPLSLKNSPISVDLYADDTTLYSTALDKSSLEADLQKALDSVHTWCLENGMLINTEKTKLMLIASRQKRSS